MISIKFKFNSSYCRYCKKDLVTTEEIREGEHNNCKTEIELYSEIRNKKYRDIECFRKLMISKLNQKSKYYEHDRIEWERYSHEDILNFRFLSVYYLQSYPDYFWNAVENIEGLSFRYCEYPSEFEKIKNLHFLEFVGIAYSNIPSVLYHLSNLKRLSIWRCDISTISPDLSNLTKLSEINISETLIESLPSIKKLNNLKKLILENNKFLSYLPQGLDFLNSLEILHINNCGIKFFPTQILKLNKLRDLTLTDIILDYSTTEQIFDRMKNLRVLSLEKCDINELPTNILNCKELVRIKLTNNKMSNLPDEIFNLPNLQELILNNNKFSLKKIRQIQKKGTETGIRITI